MAGGPVVLVVEDEEPNRALLRAVLARATDGRLRGLVVLEAPDLATARAILETNRVDLVLLDVRLPDGNGLSLIWDWANRGGPSPEFVVLSASVLPDERATAMATGASAFLAKPYRPTDLVEAVASILAGRPTNTE
jgi:two-component system, OmpR family, KDP operon response regulator KdpE